MTLSDRTKIGMTIGQMVALISLIFSVGGGVAVGLNTAKVTDKKVEDVVVMCHETRQIYDNEIKQIKKDAAEDRKVMLELIREVRESQIRIEGELKLKQDRYATR